MAVFDEFDRGALGANWESPTGTAVSDNGPLIMISGLDGVEMNPIDVNDENCTGSYVGQSFDFDRQYAEVEYLEEIVLDPYSAWEGDYAQIGCLLNVPPVSTGSERHALFSLVPALSSPSYDPMRFGFVVRDDDRVPINFGTRYLPTDLFFTAPRIPVGTKLRFERKGNVFTGFIYSPDTLLWYEAMSFEDTYLTDGNPGIHIYSTDSADDARVTNFRAGTTGDPFIDLAAKVPGRVDAPGKRNKHFSRFIPGQNDSSYRLGANNEPSEGTYDNKNRNRFS